MRYCCAPHPLSSFITCFATPPLLIFRTRGQPLFTDQSTTTKCVVPVAHCTVRFMGTCGECSRECFCYLLDDLCHVLSALVLQAGELEQLCDPPDADDVVLVEDLSQGPAAQALETRQQVHVCHAQHVVGVFRGQLARGRGELASRPTHSSLANRLLLCFSRDSLRCCSAHHRTGVQSAARRQQLRLPGPSLPLN